MGPVESLPQWRHQGYNPMQNEPEMMNQKPILTTGGWQPLQNRKLNQTAKAGAAPNVWKVKKPFLIHHQCIAQGNIYPDRYSVTHPKTDPTNSWRTK